jgi:hypothetical protein
LINLFLRLKFFTKDKGSRGGGGVDDYDDGGDGM